MKGFVFSLISFVIVFSLFLLFSYYSSTIFSIDSAISNGRDLYYAAYVFDDIAQDFDDVLGLNISTTNSNSSYVVVYSDRFPINNRSSFFENYPLSEYASRLNANLSLNVSNITDGSYDVLLGGWKYSIGYGNNYIINVTKQNNLTNFVQLFVVNITSPKQYSVIDWPSSIDDGQVVYNITFTDPNTTLTYNGRMRPLYNETMDVVFVDGSRLRVYFYPEGLFLINASNTSISFSFLLSFNSSDYSYISPSYQYDALLTYEQPNIKKETLVGVK